MKKKIIVRKELRQILMEKFNVSSSTVCLALNFVRLNPSHCAIRNYAVNNLKGIYIEIYDTETK